VTVISSLLSTLSSYEQNEIEYRKVSIDIELFAFTEQYRLIFVCLDFFLFDVFHPGSIFLKKFAVHRFFVHACDVSGNQSNRLHIGEVNSLLEIIEICYFTLIETIRL
jgi:hypothetical protein